MNTILLFFFLRPRNACRTEQTDNLQTDIIRIRTAQYSEPSSRRGSVGVSANAHLLNKHIQFTLLYFSYCNRQITNNFFPLSLEEEEEEKKKEKTRALRHRSIYIYT